MRGVIMERIDTLQRDMEALKEQLDAKTAELHSLRRKIGVEKEARQSAQAKVAATVPQQPQQRPSHPNPTKQNDMQQSQQRPSHPTPTKQNDMQQSQQQPSLPTPTKQNDIVQRLAPDIPCFAGSSRKPTRCVFSQGNREVPYKELQDLGADIFGPGSEKTVMKLIDQSKAHWFDSFGDGPVVLYTRHHHAGGGDRLETILASIFPPQDENSIQPMSLQPGDLVYDIGSNIGTTAVLLLKHFPGISLVTFEPVPETFFYLCWNAMANRVDTEKFFAYHAGLSSHGQNIVIHWSAGDATAATIADHEHDKTSASRPSLDSTH